MKTSNEFAGNLLIGRLDIFHPHVILLKESGAIIINTVLDLLVRCSEKGPKIFSEMVVNNGDFYHDGRIRKKPPINGCFWFP